MIKYNVCSINCNKNNKIVFVLYNKLLQLIFFNNVLKKKIYSIIYMLILI